MRTLIALLLTCAPLWGQGSDAAAPDGERGFGERAELHETVELFRKAKGEDLVFVQGLHQLLSDVRLHVHLARSVYRERGYFELVQGVEEEFAPLFVTADQFDFVAFSREMEEDEARAYARLFYDVRFRARRWLIASSEVDIEELAGAMRLLDAAHRGRVLLQKGWDLQRITSRADLAAARLRAVLKDLEALYEAPANALDELDTTEVEELVTLLRTADKKGKALLPEAGLRLERSAARMVLGTHTLRFDEKRGFRFITYAVWWIRQSILRSTAIRRRMVTAPSNRVEDLKIVETVLSRMTHSLGRTPTDLEIAAETGFTKIRVRRALDVASPELRLDRALYGDEEEADVLSRFATTELSADQELETVETGSLVRHCFDILDDREREIMRCHYGFDGFDPMTLEAIGQQLGLTRERICQLRNIALERIRERFGVALHDVSRN